MFLSRSSVSKRHLRWLIPAVWFLDAWTSFAFGQSVSPGGTNPDERVFHGRVVVHGTDRPIAGAIVNLVELDRRTITNEEGEFRFIRMPRGRFTLGVHAVSFASIHRTVEFPSGEPLVLELDPDSHFQEEVTVTAVPFVTSPLDSAQSVDMVDQGKIKASGDSSIGEVLENVPGVANIGVGDGLGTPVVRGISENRIRVMNDGVQTNYQQWSSRHSPNVEPMQAERIEVVRGPASVMWGPDALGGVINVVRPPLPTAEKGKATLHGDVGLGYLSNNGQGQGQLALEGAYGSFGWRIGAIRRDGGDLETPEGTLPNTDFTQSNANASVGFTGNWGTWRLRWQHWDNDVGFFFPPTDPRSEFRLDLGDDSYSTDFTIPTTAGDVLVLLSHQHNTRKARPVPTLPPPVDLELDTNVARFGLAHEPIGGFKGKVSLEYQGLRNDTFGPATLVPGYDGDNYSVMAFEEARFLPVRDADYERLILSLGLRYDSADLVVPDAGSSLVPDGGFDETYSSLTGSIGLVYRVTRALSIAANAGRGWRPPSAFELFADGNHVGVGAYQLGNPTLEAESNLSTELSLRYQSRHMRAVLTGYRSDFDDYIYLREVTGEPGIPPGLPEPVFSYGQTDAVIDGIEFAYDVVPLEQLQLGVLYSQVNTENESTGGRLPQTPPDRISLSARGMAKTVGLLVDPFVELEWLWVDDGVPSGPDEPYWNSGNAATGHYDIGNFKAGFKIATKSGIVGVDLSIRNLLDTNYTDFLYPYKVWGVPNPGRDIRLLTRFVF